jgi:hypothetical protein
VLKEGLQDPREGLPVLLESPLVLRARGVVVVRHLGKLLLRDGLVLHDVCDLPHLALAAGIPAPLYNQEMFMMALGSFSRPSHLLFHQWIIGLTKAIINSPQNHKCARKFCNFWNMMTILTDQQNKNTLHEVLDFPHRNKS